MPAVCLYFQVHQPYRIKPYRIFDVGKDHDYFNGDHGKVDNYAILSKVAAKCYLPCNAVLLDLLEKHADFSVSFSFSGVFLDQLIEFAPAVLESFRKLVDTGRVEILSETYYHSLSFLYSKEEFVRQIILHDNKIKEVFNVTPRVFRNTELIYNNEIAEFIEKMGFKGILAEGADHVLEWRSPNFVYSPKDAKRIKLLLKDYKLSDDIAFRFSSNLWEEYPLDAGKFASWISKKNGNADIINLFMDYETFGEHQWEDTGIFEFLKAFPSELLKNSDNHFVMPSEAIEKFQTVGEMNVPDYTSWADIERDLSAWLSNPLQHEALTKLYNIESQVLKSENPYIINDWRRLQTSDNFYYMCTKWFADGDVHKYFNPYESPYDAFIYFMNALTDLEIQLKITEPDIYNARLSPKQEVKLK